LKRNLLILHKEDPHYLTKTLRGLLRESDRYEACGVIDVAAASEETSPATSLGQLPDGIPVFSSLASALDRARIRPEHCTHTWNHITSDGCVPEDLERHFLDVLRAGLTLVNPSHVSLAENPRLRRAAWQSGGAIIDLRRTKAIADLPAWSDEVLHLRAPRIPVLGTDQASGKRTTCRWLTTACRERNIRAEMIYTGQTGWLQGGEYGFILDCTPTAFVSGALAHEVLRCHSVTEPDVIFIEGQSSLGHGVQPNGLPLIRPVGARQVILQHVPGRRVNIDTPTEMLPIDREIVMIEALGVEIIAITLSGELTPGGACLSEDELLRYQSSLAQQLKKPVMRPLEEGSAELVEVVRRVLE
jgi:uncharacterized NAD-dependent epimerase/dehydratase family protein